MREIATPCPPHAFEEPASRAARRRALPVRPIHVRLNVRLDPTHVGRELTPVVEGHVAHRVRALRDGVGRVTLDAADLVVEDVVCHGRRIDFTTHVDGVDVTFDPVLRCDEEVEFRLKFVSRPTCGLYAIGPTDDAPSRRPQMWTQGAMEDHHHWFPCFDAPEHMVTTEVVALVPDGFRAVSNGVPVEGERLSWEPQVGFERGWSRFHWRHDMPHAIYLLTVVVDDVVEVVDTRGATPLFHYVPAGREADAREIFERVPEMVRWLGEATGAPYPYPRYGHAFLQDFMWGGMENTTLTSLTDQVLIEGRHRDEEDVERLLAHELAHQWFGNLIAPRGWTEIWLNESFATYFEILCMEALCGTDDFVRRLWHQRDGYLDEARSRYIRPVVARRFAHPYVLFDQHAYEKGCLVLHTLRDQLGDGAFWRGVRAYVASYRGRAADTAGLQRVFEETSGEDLSSFFEHFVHGGGHPRVGIKWRVLPRVGLEIDLHRLDDGRHVLDVPLSMETPEGTRELRVRIDHRDRTVLLPNVLAVSWVALDPEAACLIEVDESTERDPSLRARIGGRGTPIALRVRTARVLARRGHALNTRALLDALESDPSETVRIEAARALGEHRTDSARTGLLAFVQREASWRVRQAAGRALGLGADDSTVDAISARIEREDSHRARCGLIEALGDIRSDAARTVLRRHLDTPSPRDCIAATAIGALAAHESTEVIDELVLRAHTPHPRAVRAAAIAGLGRIGKALEGRETTGPRRELERALGDSLFAIRHAAAKALAELGDAEARGALVRAHDAEVYGIIRRRIREALGRLEARV